MNTDRDPTNPEVLAEAVKAWLAAQSGDEATSVAHQRELQIEADIALEAVLLEQGVLSPGDAAEFSENPGFVGVILESGECYGVTTAGEVFVGD